MASVLLLSSLAPAMADEAKKPATASPAPKAPAAKSAGAASPGEDAKTLYAMGIALSQNLAPLKLTPEELKSVQEGLNDGVLGRPSKVDFQAYTQKIREFAGVRFAAAADIEKKAGATFLEKEAAAPGASKQPTGFVYRELKAGTGASPKPTEKVKVHYKGTLTDGTVFDSSIDRGEPVVFPLTGVIPCWTQGLQLMKEGGKARLVCPPGLAYGDMGSPPKIKGGATLVFEVELLSIEK
jgi:FKBP-type peptidyl-prolyl cis-trans isomerase